MNGFFKSWKTTTIGIVALIGLLYHAYTSGGFSPDDFILLVVGVGFIASKDSDKTHSKDGDTGIGGGGIKNPPPGGD